MRCSTLAALWVLAFAACDGAFGTHGAPQPLSPGDPVTPSTTPPPSTTSSLPPAEALPPPPECNSVPTGTVYLGLDGSALGAARKDVDANADSARFATYGLFQRHVEAHIGVVVNDLFTADVAATFGGIGPYGGMPEEWYLEPEGGPMVLYTNFRIAFQACTRLLKNPPWWVDRPQELLAPPTTEGATRRCLGWMHKMWSAEPTPEQLDACVTLLTVDVASEPDTVKQWAYGCAAVFTSAQEMAR